MTLPIIDLHIGDLKAGLLWQLFRDGAAAVELDIGKDVQALWDRLIIGTDEVLPWQETVGEMAQNHHGSPDLSRSLGDVFYFQPGHHGYIGRKIEIVRDGEGRSMQIPPAFVQGGRLVSPPSDALADCCAIADRIMQALAPTPRQLPITRYRVAVQRLKYQPHQQDFQRLADMSRNSLARWSRLGFRIDGHRGELNHRLSGRWVSDFLAVLMCLPGGCRTARWLNRVSDPNEDKMQTPSNSVIVERAHIDERYFSALCGHRQSVRTEIFANGSWSTVPVGLNRLTIIPGNLAASAFGLKPILHRVVYPEQDDGIDVDTRAGNVTLLIGATQGCAPPLASEAPAQPGLQRSEAHA